MFFHDQNKTVNVYEWKQKEPMHFMNALVLWLCQILG